MEEELSDYSIDRICMFMRVMDLFNNNREKMELVPGMKEEYERFSQKLDEIMKTLTEEQRDKVLEIHKMQAAHIRSQ